MEIDFLYVPDCPNRMVARHRLDQALERTGLGGAMVREHEVDSSEEAAERGMRGSPTILIDGADPFADPAQATSLSCRLYPGDAGPSGAPSIEQLVEALRP